MKTMNTSKSNCLQSTSSLWTPLPECQQELLSGGAPKANGNGGGNGNGSGGGGSTGSSIITTLTDLLSSTGI